MLEMTPTTEEQVKIAQASTAQTEKLLESDQ